MRPRTSGMALEALSVALSLPRSRLSASKLPRSRSVVAGNQCVALLRPNLRPTREVGRSCASCNERAKRAAGMPKAKATDELATAAISPPTNAKDRLRNITSCQHFPTAILPSRVHAKHANYPSFRRSDFQGKRVNERAGRYRTAARMNQSAPALLHPPAARSLPTTAPDSIPTMPA